MYVCMYVDCSSDCDNKLTFCLRELGATGREISSQSCLYGSFRTMVVGGDNLEFIAGQNFDGGVPNPVKFTGSLWKVPLKFTTFNVMNSIVTLFV